MQSKLESENNLVSWEPVLVKEHDHVVKVKVSSHMSIQAKPGTCLIELAKINELDPIQNWVLFQDFGGSFRLQHVATGLFLDAEVKYVF